MKTTNSQKGFTLLELLIVIVIILMLVAAAGAIKKHFFGDSHGRGWHQTSTWTCDDPSGCGSR